MRFYRRAVAFAILSMVTAAPQAVLAESQALLNAGHAGALGVPVFAGVLSLVKDDQEGVRQLLYTYGATMGTTLVLKNTIDAERPNGEPESFPSGHAASAFAGAAYLQRRYGWKYGMPAYAVGTFVGYSRVENDRHYWRDVAASALLSTLAAHLLAEPEDKQVISVIADPAAREYGLRVSYRF